MCVCEGGGGGGGGVSMKLWVVRQLPDIVDLCFCLM